jgi:formate dehydrogenase subunit delta
MKIDNLIKMANDIGNFFQAESDRELAVNGIADHLRRFWDPRMRREIIDYCQKDGQQLAELVREAVARLAAS